MRKRGKKDMIEMHQRMMSDEGAYSRREYRSLAHFVRAMICLNAEAVAAGDTDLPWGTR